ncbi:MAG: zinc-dependent metalloprotease [Actinobacteria bacterium]|nr:zinc-dependent metalloprotease [Actinomycetota bacterium]
MTHESFGDIPLFREIQKLLAAGGGPVNFEIARQVALAAATLGSNDPNMKTEIERSFAAAVHSVEALVSGYCRLPFDEPVRTTIMGRGTWVTSTLDSWKWLLEHLGRRLTVQMKRMGPEGMGAGEQMGTAMDQIAPLMMGLQTGTLVGQLASEVLTRYDWPIPRQDDGRLFLVVPNVEAVAADYDFKPELFQIWLAVRDVARHLIFASNPWTDRYLRSLLLEVIDALEIDLSGFERTLMELQTGGPEALAGVAESNVQLPIVSTERHTRALERLHAFQALLEGYAGHVAAAIMPEVVSESSRIEEGMARHARSPSVAETMLENILGLSVDRDLEQSGATFCTAVVHLHGINELNRAWEAPDNLPTSAEIRDPFAWMEKVLGSQ